MTEDPMLPLLFLDVDGPLIPFGGDAAQHRVHLTERRIREVIREANPLLTRLDPANGPRIAALPARPVWATTWMDEANACVAPLLGLPDLPVLDEPDGDTGPDGCPLPPQLHWKTAALVGYAAGRPFAWVDDEIGAADRAWVAAHHPGPALLHRVDPRVGLTEDDFAVLDAWLRSVG
ncbi:hypothetical protein [Streptomyces sp. TLI_171]|uniref:hypothetical protein n=1 Tax=Streptomyces sp. TLI_171 TaxID=1938859 RepID=UPI000C17DEE2|nr:hypothetical protein [Streptomyces sp. TLI_171]RKE22647.1 hypothetical protein BX266_6094 [Streptomyces sp. TLI_171]